MHVSHTLALRLAVAALLFALIAPVEPVWGADAAPAAEEQAAMPDAQVVEPGVPAPSEAEMEQALAFLQDATVAYSDQLLANPPAGMEQGEVAMILGNLYSLGVLGAPNREMADKYLQIAMEKGVPDASVAMGAMSLTAGDGAKAIEYFQAGADAGSIDGMRALGMVYLDGMAGVEKDIAKGEQLLLEAARYGDGYALDRLMPRFAEAAQWEQDNPGQKADFPTSRAAAIDSALAAERERKNAAMSEKILTIYQGLETELYRALGMDVEALERQRVMEDKFVEAFDRIAAEMVAEADDDQTAAENAFAIGAVYSFGLAGPVNLDKADEFYRAAAERGLGEAWAALGELYAGGPESFELAMNQNIGNAIEYYTNAVDAGVARAMYALGELYLNGRDGFDADPDKALEYFVMASRAGDMEAVAELDKLLAAMTGDEREAKNLPATASELVDPEKAAQAEARMEMISSAFERVEQALRQRLEQELEKINRSMEAEQGDQIPDADGAE